jgi:hypothetical protein
MTQNKYNAITIRYNDSVRYSEQLELRTPLISLARAPRLVILAVLLSATLPVWGGISACPPNPTTVALSSTSNPDLVGSGNGCWAVNSAFNAFENFTVGTLASTYTIGTHTLLVNAGITSPTASQVFLTSSPTSDAIELSSPDTNGPCNSSGSAASGGWCVAKSAGEIMSSVVNYDIIVGTNGLRDFGLSGTYTVHSTASTVAVFMEVCTNNTVFSQSCAGGTYSFVAAGTFSGGNVTQAFAVSQALSGLTVGEAVAIREIVYITTNNPGDYGQISALDFIDTPEPATFGLTGFSLAGFCTAAVFRRKAWLSTHSHTQL